MHAYISIHIYCIISLHALPLNPVTTKYCTTEETQEGHSITLPFRLTAQHNLQEDLSTLLRDITYLSFQSAWFRMDGAQLDVNHMNDISGCSPYLFLSLVLLTWNLCFTQIGILLPEDAATKTYVYVVSLALFPVLSAATTPIKCCFSCVYRKHKCYTLFEVFLYDAIFMIMGALYLAGDNLPVFICISKSNTTEMELCRKQSSIIEGVSLLLHAILYLVGQLQLRSTATLTLPVTGRIRKAYQNILQLVALTLFADQTFSTVVRYLTSTDIKIDKTPNCGCGNGTTAAECLAILNMEVGLFIASLSAIVLIIAVWLIVKNLKDYCSCCCSIS